MSDNLLTALDLLDECECDDPRVAEAIGWLQDEIRLEHRWQRALKDNVLDLIAVIKRRLPEEMVERVFYDMPAIVCLAEATDGDASVIDRVRQLLE